MGAAKFDASIGPLMSLQVVPPHLFNWRRAARVYERQVYRYRREWVILVSGFFEPLFYLLSIGLGLNSLIGGVHIDGHIVSYAAFVAPGMLATSAMNGAITESLYNMYFRLKVAKNYQAVLTTPIDVNDIAVGEAAWAVTRGALYIASFLLCMALLGDVASWWALLCFPAAVLTSATFAGLGLAACTYIRGWQDLDIVQTVTLPLFLFSGTFFPVSLYPSWLRVVVWISPLYHSSAILQACAVGSFHWVLLAHVAVLLALLIGGLRVAARRFRIILQP